MSGRPGYLIRIKRSAEREMNALPAEVFGRIRDAILRLERNPRPQGCKKLKGGDAYRLRVGTYRVLYTIDDRQHVVEVFAVGHRRDVYR